MNASSDRALLLFLCMALTACGGGGGGTQDAVAPPPTASTLRCDDSMKAAFKPDADTTVTLVRSFAAGQSLALPGTPASPSPPVASKALCLVKLRVGPGNAGPADAPSTAAGIGIEVWLPAAADWNQRIHALGSGNWAGGAGIASTTLIGAPSAAAVAASEGAVSAQTDGGHTVEDGAFAMKPDGGINSALWSDFASRSVHQVAEKLKALSAAYYGSAARHAYWDGCSTGGRQGLAAAQAYAADFDGILAGAPAQYWSRVLTAGLYPQTVIQRDLAGVAPNAAQRALVSAAAVSACDTTLTGSHDGFVSDPAACRYDPTRDASVLCAASGGSNSSAACLSRAQAAAVNKIWYGQTQGGTAPDARTDNGLAATLAPNQLWYGLARGSELGLLAGGPSDPPWLGPFPLAADQVALNLQSSAYAAPSFRNATGNGRSLWTSLSYAELAYAHLQGLSLQPSFGRVDTDSPDLRAFRDRGGRLLVYHGLADPLIPAHGSIQYLHRVADAMGGTAALQDFYRLVLVPGLGHCSGATTVSGLPGVSPPADPPLPDASAMYTALTNWVERGQAPATIPAQSADRRRSRPLCAYPARQVYLGGDVNAMGSYECR